MADEFTIRFLPGILDAFLTPRPSDALKHEVGRTAQISACEAYRLYRTQGYHLSWGRVIAAQVRLLVPHPPSSRYFLNFFYLRIVAQPFRDVKSRGSLCVKGLQGFL